MWSHQDLFKSKYWDAFLFWVGGVWLYSNILVLCSIMLHLTLVRNVTYFPILIWQQWTKYWTKVVIHGNLVPTTVTPKGITNRSTLRYMTARLNISWSSSNNQVSCKYVTRIVRIHKIELYNYGIRFHSQTLTLL